MKYRYPMKKKKPIKNFIIIITSVSVTLLIAISVLIYINRYKNKAIRLGSTEVASDTAVTPTDIRGTLETLYPDTKSSADIILSGTLTHTSGSFKPGYQINQSADSLISQTGTHSIRFLDLQDNILLEHKFTPDFSRAEDVSGSKTVDKETIFLATLPYPTLTQKIQLLNGSHVYDSTVVSKNAPTVNLIFPVGKEEFKTVPFTVAWQANDTDNDKLIYSVLYSKDGGKTWLALDSGLTTQSLTIDPSKLAGTTNGFIRILASDGINTTTAQNTMPFTIPGNNPEVTIVGPKNNTQYQKGESVVFYGQGYDPEDEILEGNALRWTSDRDGFLGTGGTLQIYTLSEGIHTITLEVIDSEGNTEASSITITISAP